MNNTRELATLSPDERADAFRAALPVGSTVTVTRYNTPDPCVEVYACDALKVVLETTVDAHLWGTPGVAMSHHWPPRLSVHRKLVPFQVWTVEQLALTIATHIQALSDSSSAISLCIASPSSMSMTDHMSTTIHALHADVIQSVCGWFQGSELQESIGRVCLKWRRVARREVEARRLCDVALAKRIAQLYHALSEDDPRLQEMHLDELHTLIQHHPRATHHALYNDEISYFYGLASLMEQESSTHMIRKRICQCLSGFMSDPVDGQVISRIVSDAQLHNAILTRMFQSPPQTLDAMLDTLSRLPMNDQMRAAQTMDRILALQPEKDARSIRFLACARYLFTFCEASPEITPLHLSTAFAWFAHLLTSSSDPHLLGVVLPRTFIHLCHTRLDSLADIGKHLDVWIAAVYRMPRESQPIADAIEKIMSAIVVHLSWAPAPFALEQWVDRIYALHVYRLIRPTMTSSSSELRVLGCKMLKGLASMGSPQHIRRIQELDCLPTLFSFRFTRVDCPLYEETKIVISVLWTRMSVALVPAFVDAGMLSSLVHRMTIDEQLGLQSLPYLVGVFCSSPPRNDSVPYHSKAKNYYAWLFEQAGGVPLLQNLRQGERSDYVNSLLYEYFDT